MTDQTATRLEVFRRRDSREKLLHPTIYRRIRLPSCVENFRIDGIGPRAWLAWWFPRCFHGFPQSPFDSERLRKFYNTAQPGVEILVTERFAKSRKSWLSGAMAGRHPINFPLIVQRRRDTSNLRVWSCYQMEASENKMNMFVHRH